MHKNLLEKIKNQQSGNLNEIGFSPTFFRLNVDSDKKNLEKILDDNPSIQIHDTIHQQLIELLKIKNIQATISGNLNIEESIISHLNGVSTEEYGVWVYYPWLNKVIHILDEEEFIEVRTNRNQHKITKNELVYLRTKKIGIIGLSVGQSIAFTIALERSCGEIRLADFDDIELSNLNRIKTGLYNLGTLKIIQAAREIAELDPYIKIACFKEGINEHNIEEFLLNNGKLDLLIEECDGIDVKVLSRQKAKQFGIPVVMETNDRGMIDIERYDLEPDYPILHNLLGNIDVENLKNLNLEQKIPSMMKLVGFNTVSARGKATLIELGQSLSTWPQLASSVILGSGIVTDVARRILLKELNISGRFYVDVENIIHDEEIGIPAFKPPVISILTREEMESLAESITNADQNIELISNEVVKKIVLKAATAPSSGNDQPWKFFFKNNSLFLFHDKSRSFSFGDYKHMASYTAFGAAIENVILSAHEYQTPVSLRIFPIKDDSRCIAVFDFKNKWDETTENSFDNSLFNFIDERCTNRKVLPNQVATKEVLDELTKATESVDGAKLTFITEKDKLKILGNIISACDRMRVMHPHGHYDFFNREMRWSVAEADAKKDGMDITTLEIPPQAMLALQVISNQTVIKVLRDIDGMQAYKWVSVPNAINASAMGLIEMPSYTPIDFINGGRAMQRQWLLSTKLGYAYQPMIMPLYLFPRMIFGNGEGLNKFMINELLQLRKQFMNLFPGEEKRGEVFLFRIFKADTVERRSQRLPLSDILSFSKSEEL